MKGALSIRGASKIYDPDGSFVIRLPLSAHPLSKRAKQVQNHLLKGLAVEAARINPRRCPEVDVHRRSAAGDCGIAVANLLFKASSAIAITALRTPIEHQATFSEMGESG